MKTRTLILASLTVVLVLGVMSSAWAQQVQLNARKEKTINGIQAELRGSYRANPNPNRLNAELDRINIPLGTPVAFCMLQNGVKTLIGVGRVAMVGGVPEASVELSANDGAVVPSVSAGDVLQARQRKVAPFKSKPTCGTGLLISAAFQ